jgi:glycerol-3-phosphate dehydrogenase
VRERPAQPLVRVEDLQALIDECNAACPDLDLSLGDVSFYHRGLVWLDGGEERASPLALSREARLVDHGSRGGPDNVISAAGVKYTTARRVAERAVDAVFRKLGRVPPACRTAQTPVHGGEEATLPPLEDAVGARLAAGHGSRAPALARLFATRGGWCAPLAPGEVVLRGEVLHAVRDEMALHLPDVILRRTELGAEECPRAATLEAAAACMGEELGWSAARRLEEIEAVRRAYLPLGAGTTGAEP